MKLQFSYHFSRLHCSLWASILGSIQNMPNLETRKLRLHLTVLTISVTNVFISPSDPGLLMLWLNPNVQLRINLLSMEMQSGSVTRTGKTFNILYLKLKSASTIKPMWSHLGDACLSEKAVQSRQESPPPPVNTVVTSINRLFQQCSLEPSNTRLKQVPYLVQHWKLSHSIYHDRT